jgi:hypothetical protein
VWRWIEQRLSAQASSIPPHPHKPVVAVGQGAWFHSCSKGQNRASRGGRPQEQTGIRGKTAGNKPSGVSWPGQVAQGEVIGWRGEARRHPARCQRTPSRSHNLRSDKIAERVATIGGQGAGRRARWKRAMTGLERGPRTSLGEGMSESDIMRGRFPEGDRGPRRVRAKEGVLAFPAMLAEA